MTRSYADLLKVLVVSAAAGYLVTRAIRPTRLHAGQVAVITGGSRGLGLALAHRFGKAGLKLVLAAPDEHELARALDDLIAQGSVRNKEDVLPVPCDLRNPAEAPRLIKETLLRFARLDVLINNAGIIVVGPALDQPLEVYREAMEVDFFAALQCIYAALPQFVRQQSGAIVNISSIGGKFAVPHLLPYVAAKFALTGLSQGLHAELRNQGIRVTTVCPGLMRTGGETHAQFEGRVDKEKAWFQIAAQAPILAADVTHAANEIYSAVDQARVEITITPQAWLAARFAGLAPATTQRIAALIHAHLLPSPIANDSVQV